MTESKNTPGPWFWDIRPKYKHFQLVSEKGGHMIVMDFTRWGMQSAQPRFSDRNGEIRGGIMIDGNDIDLSKHPDACLIKAAPDLLEVAKAGLNLSKYMAAINWDGSQNTQDWLDGLREQIESFQTYVISAITKAEPQS